MKELLLQAKNIELYLISGREPKKAEMGRVGKPGFLSFYRAMSVVVRDAPWNHTPTHWSLSK